MLKGFWKEHEGQKLFYKLRDLMGEIKLGFQRFWLGFDYSEVWNIDSSFIIKMNLMLPILLKNHMGFPYDMTKEEWESVLQEMIDEFRLADEDNFMRHYAEKYDINLIEDDYNINDYCTEYDKHRKRALELFVKYFDSLWD